jgi:hypothetical protein
MKKPRRLAAPEGAGVSWLFLISGILCNALSYRRYYNLSVILVGYRGEGLFLCQGQVFSGYLLRLFFVAICLG